MVLALRLPLPYRYQVEHTGSSFQKPIYGQLLTFRLCDVIPPYVLPSGPLRQRRTFRYVACRTPGHYLQTLVAKEPHPF